MLLETENIAGALVLEEDDGKREEFEPGHPSREEVIEHSKHAADGTAASGGAVAHVGLYFSRQRCGQ